MSVRVHQLHIGTFMGIEEKDIDLGTVTTVSGANATGKTSVVEAFKTFINGGHDASLIRQGADSAELILILDDGRKFRKSITKKGAYLTGENPDGSTISSPKTVLEGLFDSLAMNPVSFITAPPSKRSEWLLEAVPIKVTDSELSEAAGRQVTGGELNGLESVARVRKSIYEERTKVNAVVSDKTATVKQLQGSLPAASASDIAAKVVAAENELRGVDAQISTAKLEIEVAAKDEIVTIQRTMQQNMADANAAARASIADLEAKLIAVRGECDRHKQHIEAEAVANISKVKEFARGQLDASLRDKNEQRTVLAATLAGLKAQAEEHQRADNTRTIIAQMEQVAGAKRTEATALTTALERLDALKLRLLSGLPKGWEAKPDDLYVDGIPFSRINTAKQWQIALRLAKMRNGKFALVDGAECLDAANFSAFEAAAPKTGMQFLVTRVTDGALKVEAK